MRLVVLLGYSRRGVEGLDPVAAARVRRAAQVARPGDVVLVSGTPAEVSAMAAAWPGPHAPLRDAAARRTADSAAAAAAVGCGGEVGAVVVVTSWWHMPRAWLLFRLVVRSAVRVEAAPAGGPWRLWDLARELAAALAVPVQAGLARHRACATLERAPT